MAGVVALAAFPAFGISKVGNSRVADHVQGFETVFPEGLYSSRELPQDGLELQTLPKFVSGSGVGQPGFRSLRVQLRIFEADFHKLAGFSPDELRKAFLGMNSSVWWESRTHDPCILAFLSEQGNLYQLVTTWGHGKGLVVLGEKDPDIQRGMREMLSELRLEPGACGW